MSQQPSSPPLEDPLRWVLAAAEAADDKLGTDTTIVDVGNVLGITGHFIISTGRNRRQVRAIGEEIEAQLTGAGGPKPLRVEGSDDYEWLLLDYGDFVVHVLDSDARAYYDLDRLFGDQPRVPFTPAPRSPDQPADA